MVRRARRARILSRSRFIYHSGVTNAGTVTPDPHDLAAARLRTADQRYTRSRQALIEVLAGADAPMTVDEIVARDDGLALSTAYRNPVSYTHLTLPTIYSV